VLGGPHVTLIPEDAQPHADAIVVGYAEDSWPQLLRDFASGQLQPRYDQAPGLDLADRPFARRELLPSHRYLTNNVFEATRGCIHNCDFCVVPTAWGRKPYQKPVAQVIADIRQHGARKLIFIDLNLIADRDYACELFTALIPLRVQWYGLATVLLADDSELLTLAAQSGCKGLLMGLESISPQNLRQSHKGFNSPEKYAQVVERLHQHGIALQGCFVFGLDHDAPLRHRHPVPEYTAAQTPRFRRPHPHAQLGTLRRPARRLPTNEDERSGIADRDRSRMETCLQLPLHCPPHRPFTRAVAGETRHELRLPVLRTQPEPVLQLRLDHWTCRNTPTSRANRSSGLKSEIRMTKSERNPKPEHRIIHPAPLAVLRVSGFIRHSSFVIRIFPSCA